MTQLHVSTLSTKKAKSSKILAEYVYKGRAFSAAFCVLGGTFMKRMMIVACPGSGKSTLALMLGKQLNLPVFHMD